MQAADTGRITLNPDQMGGCLVYAGLRIPVVTVLRMLAAGMTEAKILHDYPDLKEADIRACLRFAAESTSEHELSLLRPA